MKQKNLFSSVPKVQIPRSKFHRPSDLLTSFDAGGLYPIYIDEVVPGDTFSMKMTAFGRLSTPQFSPMDNLYLDVHWFFCPTRLVWNNWERMMGHQDNPGDSIDYTVPQAWVGFNRTTPPILNIGTDTLSLAAYFGVPSGYVDTTSGTATWVGPVNFSVNALPLRAYNKIWNEWYRDENLQDSVTVNMGDDDVLANQSIDGIYKILPRGKRADMFTTALPMPQKGAMTYAPITFDGEADPTSVYVRALPTDLTASLTNNPIHIMPINTSIAVTEAMEATISAGPAGIPNTMGIGPDSNVPSNNPAPMFFTNLGIDLSTIMGVSSDDIRNSLQIKRFLERDNRGGTRYTEIIRTHYGVEPPDERLQRPEYLGGESMPLVFKTVPQTSATGATTAQGNISSHGVVGGRGGWHRSFFEHGYIIGLASVRSCYHYPNSLNRLWSRQTRYDFYFPVLAHLPERAILSKEVRMTSDNVYNETVFGYQEIWSEYRYRPSYMTGWFNPASQTPLDSWHFAQDFINGAFLNDEFIADTPPVDRVLQTTGRYSSQFLLNFDFDLTCVRPMPMYSIPGWADHF